MSQQDNNMCFLARIVLEAQTPLQIGSGKDNVKTDATINRDVNGLPFIPATTILGLIRHAIGEETAKRFMGWQDKKLGSMGSSLAVTDAKIVGKGGIVVDGLWNPSDIDNDEYLANFRQMPIRQHVRINHRGVAADKGKFDEEIIPQGVRFCFEMELRSNEDGQKDFQKLLNTIADETFRIGGGSRSGFGKISVVKEKYFYKELNFSKADDLQEYIDKSASLEKPWPGYKSAELGIHTHSDAIRYELSLHPMDFILFSAGLGNENTDMAVIKEPMVEWTDDTPRWIDDEKTLVVPASSVKGAISHRTAFYYNKKTGVWADEKITKDANIETRKEEAKAYTGKNNKAVNALFGSEGEKSDNKTINKRRGHVLFSDMIREKKSAAPKVINHVKIDRFTGGAIDGALFDEEPLYAKNETITLNLFLIKDDEIDENITSAFEDALRDICHGTLALGGGVNRGNGCFRGTLKRNGEDITEKQNEQ